MAGQDHAFSGGLVRLIIIIAATSTSPLISLLPLCTTVVDYISVASSLV